MAEHASPVLAPVQGTGRRSPRRPGPRGAEASVGVRRPASGARTGCSRFNGISALSLRLGAAGATVRARRSAHGRGWLGGRPGDATRGGCQPLKRLRRRTAAFVGLYKPSERCPQAPCHVGIEFILEPGQYAPARDGELAAALRQRHESAAAAIGIVDHMHKLQARQTPDQIVGRLACRAHAPGELGRWRARPVECSKQHRLGRAERWPTLLNEGSQQPAVEHAARFQQEEKDGGLHEP